MENWQEAGGIREFCNYGHKPNTSKMDESSHVTIIEFRDELMVSSSSGGNPTLRSAYFIKPLMEEDSPPPHFLPPHFTMLTETATKLPLEVRYNGWRMPQEEWKTWVKKLQPKFEYLWRKAGIDEAITASTYEIKRDDELILSLATRWCSKTNTFVFLWGEATITLEDIKHCWGYSILGGSISSPLVNSEQKEAEEELIEARRMFNSSKARKVAHRPWMMHFMENESKVEHEAFLVYWLSRFVFPADAFETILKSVFPIAIHLARGNKIALAPAVLASIYRDLSVLKSTIIINNNATTIKNFTATLWAPFQLVQIWALERFPSLNSYRYYAKGNGLPKVARWGGLKLQKNKNLKLILDSAGIRNQFLWRPYENSPSIKVYNAKDKWECDNPDLDEELQSFARCLRVCELEGMGCKEKYFPHRVAMQFGMDQDIPSVVVPCKKDPWVSYSRPVEIMDINLCIELCSSQPDVTSRYYDWWKQSKSGEEGDTIKVELSYGSPPGFTSKFDRDQVGVSYKEDHLSVIEVSSSSSEAKCSDDDEAVGNGKAFSSSQFGVFPSSSVGDEIDECENEAKIKTPFCDRNGVNDIKGECVSPFTSDIAFDLENRIQKLERVISKLKEAKFGSKVEIIGAKAKP